MSLVEERPASEGEGTPLKVRWDRIERFPDQPRRYFNQSSLEGLADNIQAEGQQQPVKLCTKPGHPGTFMLVDGERRWRAFGIIRERTGSVPLVEAFIAVVQSLKQHFRTSAISNMHREDLAPLDLAAALHRFHYVDGDSIANLAALLKKSTTYVDGYIRLHTLPDEVKELMHPDRPKEMLLLVTQAIDIVRGIPESAPELRIAVAHEVVERNLGVIDTRALVEMRGGKAGYQAGGRFRKPSDDYKVFTSFLGRTETHATRLEKSLDFEELYHHRDDEIGDRKNDAAHIRRIIARLELLLAKVGT